MRTFGKVLCNLPLRIDYTTSGEAGATDAKGNIVLDGRVAQDDKIGFYRKADILKGVLLDEVGHNIWTTPKYREITQAANKLGHQMKIPVSVIKHLLNSVCNLVEDLHNVTMLCKKFPGFNQLHIAAVEHYMGAKTTEILARYESELQMQGKPTLAAFMDALIVTTKARLPATGTLQKAAELALAGIEMHEPDQILAQSTELTKYILENALLPEQGPEESRNENGKPQKGDGGQTGSSKQSGKESNEKAEEEPSESDEESSGAKPSEKPPGRESEEESEAFAEKLEKLTKEIFELPEITQNAGMGKPASIPDKAKASLEETQESIEHHDGNITIHRRHKESNAQGGYSPHPEREHLALVTRSRIQAIKTKPGYTNPGYRRGKLQRRDVHKVASGKATPFSKPGKPDSPSLNIVLVTDWSGSMGHNNRGESALRLIDILSHATKKIPNVDLWAMLYTTTPYATRGAELHMVSEPGWIDPNLFGRRTGYRTPTLPALKKAVTLVPANRPTIIVLLTDGLANVGGDEDRVQQWIQDNRKRHRILSVYIDPGLQQLEYSEKHQNCYVLPEELTDKEIVRLISILNREIKRLS
jgi:Mg-chelatase subunit ChlD